MGTCEITLSPVTVVPPRRMPKPDLALLRAHSVTIRAARGTFLERDLAGLGPQALS